MSTAEFGDGTTLGPPAIQSLPADGLINQPTIVPAAAEPLAAPQLQPLAPLPPLAPAAPAPEARVAPVPTAETPAVPVTDMRDVPLGTLIFRAGLLSEEQLQEALEDGTKRGKRLGEVLLERKLVSETDLGRLLAGQKGLQFVEVDPAAVDPTAVALLHVEKARLYSVLPVAFRDGIPVVAIADPSNDLVVENVRRALQCEPLFVVAGREALHAAIDVVYGAPQPAASVETPVAPAQPVPPAPVQEVPQLASPAVPAPVEVPTVPVVPVAEQPFLLQQPAPVAPPAPNGDGVWLAPSPVEPVTDAPAIASAPVSPEVPELVVAEPVQPTAPPEPEPAAVQPVAAPVEPAVPALEPLVEVTPVVAPPVETPAAPAADPQPVAQASAPAPAEAPSTPHDPETQATWSVALRLTDGDRVEIGTFGSDEEAREHGRGVAAHLVTETSWPFFDGRFIRPEAIVSVDVVEHEPGRWLGSSARRAWNDGRA